MAPSSIRVWLTCDYCGSKFSLMPCEARMRQKNKNGIFCKPECWQEWNHAKKFKETIRVLKALKAGKGAKA